MAQYELNIHDYLRIIKKRRWIIILTSVAVIGSVMVFTNMQTQIFRATTTVKVEPTVNVGVGIDQSGWDMYTAMNTELKIIKSALVAERTAKKLGIVLEELPEEKKIAILGSIQSKVSANKVGDTNLINISATSSDPKECARLANATAEVYIEKGEDDRNRHVTNHKIFIEQQLNDAEKNLKESEKKLRVYNETTKSKGTGGYLTSQLLGLENKKRELAKKYTEQHPLIQDLNQKIDVIEKRMKEVPTKDLEYSRLMRELRLNESLYNLLARKYKEAEISAADRVTPAFIVTHAKVPKVPIKPNKRMNLMVGTFLGIFLGFVFALLFENLDTSIGTIEDVEKFLDLPVLGIIPHIDLHSDLKSLIPKGKSHQQKPLEMRYKLMSFHSSKSPFVESYHTLRTNLKLTILKDTGKILAFTSAGIAEGKTLTASNFVLAAAQSGMKTLLVEADLRRPSLHWLFGIDRGPGFSDCIIGTKKWPEIIKGTTDFLMGDLGAEKILEIPGIENVSLITSGPLVSNPIDLLNSPIVPKILKEMAASYDLIILDCPPTLLFADALIMGAYTDGTILIYQVGRMARRALKRAKDQLLNVKAPVSGIILNNVRTSEMGSYYGYGYSYYYSYKYYSKEDPNRKAPNKMLSRK